MRPEKTVNDWLDEFRGYTYKRKIIEAAQRSLFEEKAKALGYQPQISEIALVTITDPRTREIIGMGGSKPDDLVLNNFGTWLAGLIRSPAVATKTVSLKADDGTTQTPYVYSEGSVNCFNQRSGVAAGTRIKVGSGTTAPARANFQIETAFVTAPESGYFNTGDGSYGVGAITCSGSITAGGSGTINETILTGRWTITTGTTFDFLLFRDAISPGKAFVAGQLINVAYAINL